LLSDPQWLDLPEKRPHLLEAMAAADLFNLVKRLDKAERDRVKANAKRNKREGDTVYMDLFDDLVKVRCYTTDKAFKALHSQASYAKSFAKIKEYLFDFILDALRSYRTRAGEEKPRDFQIRELIEEAHLLRGKLLYQHQLHCLEKALADAEECQYYELLLEVLKQLRTHLSEHASKERAEQLQGTLQRIGQVGKLIDLNCQLLVFRDELFGIVRRNANPDAQVQAVLSEKLEELDRLQALGSSSIEAKTNHHLCHALYHWILGDRVQAWTHHHEVYLLWQMGADFARARSVQHIKLLNNFLTTSIAAGKSANFIDALDFLERNAGPSADAKAESIQNTAYIRLQYFLSKADWENAQKIEAEFNAKPEWVTHKTHTPRLQIFYLSFARLHFVLGDFKQALRYLGRFEDERIPNLHQDKCAEAIVLRVLISFVEPKLQTKKKKAANAEESQADPDILNEIRSARRALKKLGHSSPYLDDLLKGLKGVANLDVKKRQGAWTNLQKALRKKIGSESYDSASQLFLAWIQSQQEGKPLGQLLAEEFPIYGA
jgi:hypothetical protein